MPIQSEVDVKLVRLVKGTGQQIARARQEGIIEDTDLVAQTDAPTLATASDLQVERTARANADSQLQSQINTKQPKLTSANAGNDISITEVDGIVKINSTAEGVTVHNQLTGRDAENAHPISAIYGLQEDLDTFYGHIDNKSNPHEVGKSQVGLGNVQNVDTTNASNITSGTLNNDRLNTIPYSKLSGAASSAQGALADSAVQPGVLETAITTHNTSTTAHSDIRQIAEEALSRSSQAVQSLVFDTFADMETYLKDVAHKGALKVGDNLYIKDTSVEDYWVSAVLTSADPVTGYYYSISPLSGEKPNISNMVTTNENQTISGDKNFTGGLQKNGLDVATESFVTGQGYLTGITGAQVTNALGYTPYDSTNPSGYQNSTQVNTAITSYHDTSKQDTLVSGTNIKTVNNNSLVGSGNVSINEITSAERTKVGTVNTIFTKIGGSDVDYDLSTIECSKEGQTYGFEYGTYTYGGTSFIGLGSQNYHVANTFAYGKINFTFAKSGTLKVTAYCDAESTYDFGILSNLDQELSKDANADATNKYSFSGHQGTTYVAEYEVTAGNHFITIKYKKDGSQDTNLDRMVITKIEFKTQHGFFVASYENPSEQIEIGNTPEVDYPVTDVQMQNSTSATTYTSILDGKIAKIPKATTSAYGVVRPSNTYGTTITSGYLGIYSATAAQTQSKSSTQVPLTPARIHDIIKYGLGGYSGTAFTDAEKEKARQTIGADDAGAKITFVEWT